MINILSYVGMNLQSEVCMWTLLGLVRTIFDATLFKVNANLKQVWQMSMPAELSMPVQRVLRTMISGIMLVQCFTVYVYLASYIVLLYPVFLEEHPALVLPWLLLAAIRRLLCELTSLAIGLGTCVLLGNAKPPCIKFLITKISSIMPAFYMWLLVYSYYHALKVTSAFKSFPVPPNDPDYGLELAVRRRRTKSLFTEEHLRKKLVTGFYDEISPSLPRYDPKTPSILDYTVSYIDESISSIDMLQEKRDAFQPLLDPTKRFTDIGTCDEWFGREIIIPRGDRILEQFVIMLLRVATYLNKDEGVSLKSNMFDSTVSAIWAPGENIDAISNEETDTSPLVGNSRVNGASYLREYPHIFMKKISSEAPQQNIKFPQNHQTEYVLSTTRSCQRNEFTGKTTLSIGSAIKLINKITSSSSLSNGLNLSEQTQEIYTEKDSTKCVLSNENPSFVRRLIEDCYETIYEKVLKPKDIEDNLIEFVIFKGELADQVSCENSFTINDNNVHVHASSLNKYRGNEINEGFKDVHRKDEIENLVRTNNNQDSQLNTSQTNNTSSPPRKLKID